MANAQLSSAISSMSMSQYHGVPTSNEAYQMAAGYELMSQSQNAFASGFHNAAAAFGPQNYGTSGSMHFQQGKFTKLFFRASQKFASQQKICIDARNIF